MPQQIAGTAKNVNGRHPHQPIAQSQKPMWTAVCKREGQWSLVMIKHVSIIQYLLHHDTATAQTYLPVQNGTPTFGLPCCIMQPVDTSVNYVHSFLM